jgi:regulator of PEP synthase PpsR (kinase-PPPase family)
VRGSLTLHILSDSVGETADTVAQVVAIQFPQLDCQFEFTTMIDSVALLRDTVCPHRGDSRYVFVYTFTNRALLAEMDVLRREDGVNGIDVLGSALATVTALTGEEPSGAVGILHQVDSAYFRRIAAMEFAVNHDDGQLPETLIEADVVIIGVSRTSKTPLSMYLAHRGYKTANIPLALEIEPPAQLFEIDPAHIFGLVSSTATLTKVRAERLQDIGAPASDYATPAYVERDAAAARSLMRRLGCLVINTSNRAIESVAQEIMSYLR